MGRVSKSKKQRQGIVSSESMGYCGYLVTFGKFPGYGGGRGFLFICLVWELVEYFKLFSGHL